MKSVYDKYYKTENLFGEAYPELINYFKSLSTKLRVLDLGCGQGRDALALAKLGFDVTGVDYSKVGIKQMEELAVQQNLKLVGIVGDVYKFEDVSKYDVILLNSMFHFLKKDKQKEKGLIQKIYQEIKPESLVVFCIQATKQKLNTLFETFKSEASIQLIENTSLVYKFYNEASGHLSETPYRIVVVKKIKE